MRFKKFFQFLMNHESNLKPGFEKPIIGENVSIHNSLIGVYSYISRNSNIHNCEIGKFCSIGPNVTIGFGNHPTNFISTSPIFYDNSIGFDLFSEKCTYDGKTKVIIENDVWIGANVFIKNGVRIKNGAIIGAGAVVINDVPEYAIAAGVPARVKKMRFSQKKIRQLLELEWWELSAVEIKELIPIFSQSDLMSSDEKFNELIERINNS
jgi:acetyltransferase-like isoleucine patch superfamily enzyme